MTRVKAFTRMALREQLIAMDAMEEDI